MKKILFICLTFVSSLMFFELFLEYSPFKKGISPVEYDKDIGMWHKKNFSDFSIRKCYKTQYFFDEKGRVKNTYQYNEKKEDIIILGDSFIDASMVENKNIIHNALFRELNGEFNVLNYGLTGAGPMQELAILKYKVPLKKVKRVIQLVEIEGDLSDCDSSHFNGSNRPKVFLSFSDLEHYQLSKPIQYSNKEKMRDFLGNFEFYGYLNQTYIHYKSLLEHPKAKRSKEDKYFMENEEYRWKQLYGTLYQTNKIALKYKFAYIILIYSSNEFSFNYRQRSQRLESFLKKHDIAYLNIVSFLQEINKKHPLSFECDGHWNGKTHQDLARYLHHELF